MTITVFEYTYITFKFTSCEIEVISSNLLSQTTSECDTHWVRYARGLVIDKAKNNKYHLLKVLIIVDFSNQCLSYKPLHVISIF